MNPSEDASREGIDRSNEARRQGGRTRSGLRGQPARPIAVRPFDPARDDPRVIGRMNDWPAEAQARMSGWYARALRVPDNLLVAVDVEDDAQIVGCAHLFDAGLPYAFLESVYLTPAYRSLRNARAIKRAVDHEFTRRGLLGYAAHVPATFARLLGREGMRAHGTYTLVTQELNYGRAG